MVGNLCVDCFLELYGLTRGDRAVEIVLCPRCYAIRIHGKWLRPASYEEFLQIVREEIARYLTPSRPEVKIESIQLPQIEPYQHRVPILIKARVGEHFVERRLDVAIAWKKNLCPMCFKRAAGSYQAVVQIRYVHSSPEIDRFKHKLTEMFPEDIVEIDEVRNGFDVKLSSDHVARRIALIAQRMWKAVKIVESYGDQRRRRDGRRTARLYISVRILNFAPGDYIVIDHKAYTVVSIDDDRIVLQDSSGRKRILRLRELPKRLTRP